MLIVKDKSTAATILKAREHKVGFSSPSQISSKIFGRFSHQFATNHFNQLHISEETGIVRVKYLTQEDSTKALPRGRVKNS